MDAMKDLKDLLDGDGSPAADAAPGILESRPGQCGVHGDFVDQQIQLRVYVGVTSPSQSLIGLAALNAVG